MAPMLRNLMSTVVWGGVAAGPVAALAMAQAPVAWRGPVIPVAALIISVACVALWRHATGATRAARPPRFGDPPED